MTTVDRSIRMRGGSAPVVIATEGSSVTFGSLAAEPAPEQGAGQIVVGDLPGAPPAFVARQAVDRVAEVFTAGGGVAVVSALTVPGGTGKTQVAAQYARQAVAEGIELVAWVSAEDSSRLLAGLAEVADRLGVADREGDSGVSATRLRDVLAARAAPAVLVLDSASDPQAVRRYLLATGQTRVIITTNDRAFTSLGADVSVDVFDRTQSVAYLAQRTGLDDDAGAASVADELGDLPLALAQAATAIKLQDLSYELYLDRMRSLPLEEMLPADRGDAYPYGVVRVVFLSVEAVERADPSPRRGPQLLGRSRRSTGLTQQTLESAALLAAEGVSRHVLAEVLGASAHQSQRLDQTLARLVEASLVVWAKDRSAVVMHRLVARAIRDRLQASGDFKNRILDVANGLKRLLVPNEQAWKHREAGVEVVGHVMGVWDNAVSAAAQGVLTPEDLEAHTHLAQWAVRHLLATADLSGAIEIGTSVLDACESYTQKLWMRVKRKAAYLPG